MQSYSLPKINVDSQTSDRQETRDICHPRHVEPVGLALASNGTACITWKSPKSVYQTDVCLYARDTPYVILSEPLLPPFERYEGLETCLASIRSKSMPYGSIHYLQEGMLTQKSYSMMEAQSYGKF